MTPLSFEVVPGDAASTVVLHVPHSSRTVPPDVRRGILLDDAALERELDAITDARTDEIALGAAEAAVVRPWVFVNRLSRLVVDPERFPDEREEMSEVGMGAVYERTTGLEVLRRPTDGERASLLAAYFEPYADALARLVRERLAAVGRVTVLDVHSYARDALPYERHGDGPRPEVCLGTDAFHTPPSLVAAARACFEPHVDDLGLDSPFAGCYVPLEHYGVEPAVTGLMLELRRDVVAARLDRLASATGALVDRVEDDRPR
ncbi:N-formylglutamate amidohydrolase [Nocardioides marinquilinus]|uniref:N-formylglutamate amidohydrolase n=1 Tax=Nocardioides marinquilinus TaxID=1210400 RepID=A0ABP9Q0Q5_9ACTN